MNRTDRPEMSLRDYWRVLMRRKWVMIVGVVCTVAPAVALISMHPKVYEATAQILLQSANTSGTEGATAAKPSVQNEIQVLESTAVYERLINDLGLSQGPPGVFGTPIPSTDSIYVTVDSGDAATAAFLANAYVDAYINTKQDQSVASLLALTTQLQTRVDALEVQIGDLDTQLSALADDADTTDLDAQRRQLVDEQASLKQRLDNIEFNAALATEMAVVINPAGQPAEPISPTPRRTALLALAVGLLLAVAAAFLIDYLDDSLKNPDDLEKLQTDAPLLALIPFETLPDGRPLAISRPDHFAVEMYRTLRTNVQFLGLERSVQVIQITSSVPGEGKTTTAANLAVVLAQSGNSVVLVDADLRRPRIHRMFNIDRTLGLTSNLVAEPLDMTLQSIDSNLSVITSGPVPPNPSELLSSRRMDAIIAELRLRFDYVILDSPPALAVSDAVALSRHVDGVVLVLQAGRTSVPQVRRALAALDQVNAPVLGLVLNRVSHKRLARSEYMYAYDQPYIETPRAKTK